MLSARVVRQNFTFLYQHLAVANILPVVVENGIITEAKRKEVESYTQKYAQSIVVIGALFLCECPLDGLVRLTDVLAMTTGQEQVARKLLDGENIISYVGSCVTSISATGRNVMHLCRQKLQWEHTSMAYFSVISARFPPPPHHPPLKETRLYVLSIG